MLPDTCGTWRQRQMCYVHVLVWPCFHGLSMHTVSHQVHPSPLYTQLKQGSKCTNGMKFSRPERGLNPRPSACKTRAQITRPSTLRKHAYSNIVKILPAKHENSDILQVSAQNIDCGYSLESPQWGSSNEYPQSMFLSRNKKNNVYPCKPQYYNIKVGFKRVKII